MREKAEFRTAARCRSAAPIVPAPVPWGERCASAARARAADAHRSIFSVRTLTVHTYIHLFSRGLIEVGAVLWHFFRTKL